MMSGMTMFSSRPPFNDDPNPLVYRGERYALFDRPYRITKNEVWTDKVESRPRPEFERPQHNSTNPILVDARAVYHLHGARILEWFENNLAHAPWGDEEQIEHARLVLGRVSRLHRVLHP